MCNPISDLPSRKIGNIITKEAEEVGKQEVTTTSSSNTTTTMTTMNNMAPQQHQHADQHHHHQSILSCSDRSFATTATSATCSSAFSSSSSYRGCGGGILVSSSKDNNNNKKMLVRQRQVSFHEVQIRRYPMVMGDHPSVQMGAPVTIDWDYEELPSVTLDDFESIRCNQRRHKLRQLILNYYHRRAILSRLGYTIPQQKQASKEVSKIQRQRSITIMLHPISKIEEMAQSAKRKIDRRLSFATNTTNKRSATTV